MKRIAEGASGFLYLVSKVGVTGSEGLDTGGVGGLVETLRNASGLPICVGFGISTPEQVKGVAEVADGVVIGSAFERLIEENIEAADLVEKMAERTRTYKAATRVG
jgi:tryptophan synthase alpha chain